MIPKKEASHENICTSLKNVIVIFLYIKIIPKVKNFYMISCTGLSIHSINSFNSDYKKKYTNSMEFKEVINLYLKIRY